MSRLVVYVDIRKPVENVASKLDEYLSGASASLGPIVGTVRRTWNVHRDRLTIHGNSFSAEVAIVPKGIVVMAEIPPILFPFRQRIEDRVRTAVGAVVGKGDEEV